MSKEAVGDGVGCISVSGGELTVDGLSVFCCVLSSGEGGNGSVVGAREVDGEGVSAGVASKLAKIFEYSIDFFKIQKGDKFAITLNERYIHTN